jgi:WD40 repeat protein
LVSGSTDKNVILWDLDDESNTLVFKGHEDTVTTTISFEDEQHVASGGADRKIIVWDISNGKINCVLPCNGSIYKLHKLKQGGGKNYFFSCDHSQALNIFKIEYAQRNRSISIALEKVILTPCYIYGLTSSLTNPLMVLGS